MGTHPKERRGEVVKESRGSEDKRRHEKGKRRTGTEREMQQQGEGEGRNRAPGKRRKAARHRKVLAATSERGVAVSRRLEN
jgi:hypothetical protein